MIWIKLMGMWILGDSLYSLRTYWGKEDIFNQGIRAIRLVCAVALIIFG